MCGMMGDIYIMKRKIFILAAALLLSGCADANSGGYTSLTGKLITDNSSEPSDITESIETSVITERITLDSGNKPDSVSSVENSVSAADERSLETESVFDTPREGEFTLSFDPLNARKITVSGDTLTISGKMGASGVTGVAIDKNYGDLIPCETYGDEFSCVISADDMTSGYHSIKTVYENSKFDAYRVYLGDEGFEIPLSPEVEENNEKIIGSPKELSEEGMVRCIAIGGDRSKCSAVLSEIKALSDEICGELDSDYDKLRAISEWTAYNIFYDHPMHDKGMPEECLTLEYMLKNKTSVCGGYSNMVSALCAAQGIECYNVKGRSVQNQRCFAEISSDVYHEWNFAVIDGRHVIVDAGWNSQSFYRGGNNYKQSAVSFKYFDISPDIFALDHKAQSAEHRNYSIFMEGEQ